MVKYCGCKHGPFGTNAQGASFQDARYGAGMRVHTIRTGKDKGHFCTVCGRNNRPSA